MQKESILKLKVLGFFLLTPFIVPATGLLYLKSDPVIEFIEKSVGTLLSSPMESALVAKISHSIVHKESEQLFSEEPVLVYRVQDEDDLQKLRVTLAKHNTPQPDKQPETLVVTEHLSSPHS